MVSDVCLCLYPTNINNSRIQTRHTLHIQCTYEIQQILCVTLIVYYHFFRFSFFIYLHSWKEPDSSREGTHHLKFLHVRSRGRGLPRISKRNEFWTFANFSVFFRTPPEMVKVNWSETTYCTAAELPWIFTWIDSAKTLPIKWSNGSVYSLSVNCCQFYWWCHVIIEC